MFVSAEAIFFQKDRFRNCLRERKKEREREEGPSPSGERSAFLSPPGLPQKPKVEFLPGGIEAAHDHPYS